MTFKKYNKLIKRLEKDYELIRKIEPDFYRDEFGNVKVKLYRVIKTLRKNEVFWAKYKE